jgi:hypothetical protein
MQISEIEKNINKGIFEISGMRVTSQISKRQKWVYIK